MQINYFAAARAAAGVSTEQLDPAEVASDGADLTLGSLCAVLRERHTGRTPAGMSFAKVLEQCSFLVNGVASDEAAAVPADARVDVLPPFAGG